MKKGCSFILYFISIFITNAQDQPNILWIITDDHRPDALECYNKITTGKKESALGYVMSPNINKLAAKGTFFVNAYSNSPMCTPSRSSMMTGRYPFRSGHYKFYSHQEADFVKPMVSQILKSKGYGTAVFGKTGWGIYKHRDTKKNSYTDFFDYNMHFKRDLQGNGIGDIFYADAKVEFIDGIFSPIKTVEKIIYPDGSIKTYHTQLRDEKMPEVDKKTMNAVDKEFDILRSYTRLNKGLIIGGVNPQKAGNTVDGAIVKEYKSFLTHSDKKYKTLWGKEVKGAITKKPLFVNLGFHLPHTPVLPPKKYRDIFKDKQYKIPEFGTDELSNFPPQLVTLYNECKTDQLTNKEKLQAIRDYYAFCAYGDALIGEAVDSFASYCKANNQEYLIIFTIGDHGWHLGEQGIMAKFGPWKQSVQNAAIVISSDKNKFPPGKVVRDIVEFVDFTPTILSSAGIDINAKEYDYLDGYNLTEVVNGSKPSREYAIGEVNVVCGHRAYMRTQDFAFSMRTRDKWDVSKAPYLNDNITWALTCDRPKADMALYDLRKDPLEKNNIANDKAYVQLADWFRTKLGNIVLGDGRVECDWTKSNSYNISNFAGGADTKVLDIPKNIIPSL
ncbi:sulfatase-like hydrolase/transferase [Aquimarina sp. RZ0]|uniref:sulfatase-like hydrolase/transferase n=1 Tax=Aquimarina sp. RZ0 TaxID=2607730 RepID=UPI0011F32AD4|nr:sulfatase-like hydrolase/transferase [Aquimarina sp. RZ0]KAA1243085.1 sulfatase-like hydrolase/transferase [Aquimarina sp. RZ0]